MVLKVVKSLSLSTSFLRVFKSQNAKTLLHATKIHLLHSYHRVISRLLWQDLSISFPPPPQAGLDCVVRWRSLATVVALSYLQYCRCTHACL